MTTKKTIEVNWRQGCFWVRDGSSRETPLCDPGEPEGMRYQVIQRQIIDVMRSGKGYSGIELDVIRKLDEEATKMADALRAKGHDVGVLVIT